MSETTREHKIEGFVGSALLHLLLLLILFFFTLQEPWYDEEGGGIAVNFGNESAEGWGDIQPQTDSQADVSLDNNQQQQTAAPAPSDNSQLLTSDDPDAAPINSKDTKNPDDKKTPATNPRPTDKPSDGKDTKNSAANSSNNTPKVDDNSLFKGKKNNATSQGNTPNKGSDAGNPMGTADIGNGSKGNNNGGNNGTGADGIADIDLANRSASYKPTVIENSQEEGKVVIKIWVDRQGTVSRAEFTSAGSTNNSSVLKNAAIAAARKTKFNADPNAAALQQGKMTFRFSLK